MRTSARAHLARSAARHRRRVWVASLVGGALGILLVQRPVLAVCVGDCSGDDTVSVDELIRGVNIALGTLALSVCPSFDLDENGGVSVNELITAVKNALNDCSPPPTGVPSASPTTTPGAGATATRTSGATPSPSPTQGTACMDDAGEFVAVSVKSIAATQQTRTASVMFTNTHPSRRIAIAAILLFREDGGPAPAPCAAAVQGGAFASLDECHARIAGGCNSPAGLFLAPGQTSGEFFYNCLEERGEHVTTGHALAHAVFCDDYAMAQASFCSAVHVPLLDTGQPVAGFSPITTDECP